MSSRKVIRILRDDGWYFLEARGSHHHYQHPSKPGKVTVPHPKVDLSIGTLRNIWRQAGLPLDTHRTGGN